MLKSTFWALRKDATVASPAAVADVLGPQASGAGAAGLVRCGCGAIVVWLGVEKQRCATATRFARTCCPARCRRCENRRVPHRSQMYAESFEGLMRLLQHENCRFGCEFGQSRSVCGR